MTFSCAHRGPVSQTQPRTVAATPTQQCFPAGTHLQTKIRVRWHSRWRAVTPRVSAILHLNRPREPPTANLHPGTIGLNISLNPNLIRHWAAPRAGGRATVPGTGTPPRSGRPSLCPVLPGGPGQRVLQADRGVVADETTMYQLLRCCHGAGQVRSGEALALAATLGLSSRTPEQQLAPSSAVG